MAGSLDPEGMQNCNSPVTFPPLPIHIYRAVHAHVIFWLHEEDVDEAISKIRSCMPAAWDPEAAGKVQEDGTVTKGDWILPPEDAPLHRKLFKTVKRKQPHVCTPVNAEGCRKEGDFCVGHFPQPVHLEKLPSEDEVERCYRYYCPGAEHRNIGPYIPVSNKWRG